MCDSPTPCCVCVFSVCPCCRTSRFEIFPVSSIALVSRPSLGSADCVLTASSVSIGPLSFSATTHHPDRSGPTHVSYALCGITSSDRINDYSICLQSVPCANAVVCSRGVVTRRMVLLSGCVCRCCVWKFVVPTDRVRLHNHPVCANVILCRWYWNSAHRKTVMHSS